MVWKFLKLWQPDPIFERLILCMAGYEILSFDISTNILYLLKWDDVIVLQFISDLRSEIAKR